MDNKLILFTALLLSIFLFQSCFSPQNVIRLLPEKETDNWIYGQQFVSDSIDGIIYDVGFDKMTEGRYWFDFTVTNRSNLPVMIDPLYFYIQAFDGSMNPLTERRVAAINPESEILEVEKQLSKHHAQEMNQIGLGLIAATVDVATGIAAVTDDNPHNNHIRTDLMDNSLEMAAQNSHQLLSLNEVKEVWENTTIRKTRLLSNYNMKGKVFFPAFPEAVYIRLYLPVDSLFLELGFKQIQFPVN